MIIIIIFRVCVAGCVNVYVLLVSFLFDLSASVCVLVLIFFISALVQK